MVAEVWSAGLIWQRATRGGGFGGAMFRVVDGVLVALARLLRAIGVPARGHGLDPAPCLLAGAIGAARGALVTPAEVRSLDKTGASRHEPEIFDLGPAIRTVPAIVARVTPTAAARSGECRRRRLVERHFRGR